MNPSNYQRYIAREHRMNRRAFLGVTSLSIGCFPLLATDYIGNSEESSGFTDVNMNLSNWPFRRLPSDNLQHWLLRIRAQGVKQGQNNYDENRCEAQSEK